MRRLLITAILIAAGVAGAAEWTTTDIRVALRIRHAMEAKGYTVPSPPFDWFAVSKPVGQPISVILSSNVVTQTEVEAVTDRDLLDAMTATDRPDAAKWWSQRTKMERFLIRCLYRLAKMNVPTLTLDQFRAQIRTEWEATADTE